MNHLYEYKKGGDSVFKRYFIDCADIDDPEEILYLWKYLNNIGNTRILVSKLYSYINDEITEFDEGDLLNPFIKRNIYKTDIDILAFDVIYESDNFDEVYDYFMMLIDSRKYNL